MMVFRILKLCFLIIFIDFTDAVHESQCGVVARSKGEKIVGGRSLPYSVYPWYAALVFVNKPKQLNCGGSLITTKHVLTAAHCYKPWFEAVSNGLKRFEDIYEVKLGVNNMCVPEMNVQIFTTEKVYVHEKYMSDMPYFDIALLTLDARVRDFTPICLPPGRYESNNRTNLIGAVIGLGKEASMAWALPCTVKEAEIPIQPDSVCKEMLTRMNENASRFHDAFCAGDPEGTTDTCQGDSGGPLQILLSTDTYALLGITSFGYGCARKNFYGIYTDVSHYTDWIMAKTSLDLQKPEVTSDVKDVSTSKNYSQPQKVRKQQRKSQKSILNLILNW